MSGLMFVVLTYVFVSASVATMFFMYPRPLGCNKRTAALVTLIAVLWPMIFIVPLICGAKLSGNIVHKESK